MRRRPKILSPLECRILSDLQHHPDGVSCTQLARDTDQSRQTLYVLVRRMARAEQVRRRYARVPGGNQRQVLYTITAAGRKARERFAEHVGLNPY